MLKIFELASFFFISKSLENKQKVFNEIESHKIYKPSQPAFSNIVDLSLSKIQCLYFLYAFLLIENMDEDFFSSRDIS